MLGKQVVEKWGNTSGVNMHINFSAQSRKEVEMLFNVCLNMFCGVAEASHLLRISFRDIKFKMISLEMFYQALLWGVEGVLCICLRRFSFRAVARHGIRAISHPVSVSPGSGANS